MIGHLPAKVYERVIVRYLDESIQGSKADVIGWGWAVLLVTTFHADSVLSIGDSGVIEEQCCAYHILLYKIELGRYSLPGRTRFSQYRKCIESIRAMTRQ